MSTKKERKMITSGLSNLGYTAKLTAKNSNDAYPFLASHTLAAAAGRRGLEKDTALAASVARREDMRRLGVALLEIALCASGVNTLDWLAQEGRTPSSIGSVVKLGDGGEGIRRIKNSAENARLTVSDVLGEDGWKFLGILAGMEEEDNPFLKLSMATRHPYVKY
uniref:Uncharacterized protein n=1 Tax=Amorphochlora amoebiformis TaxID=1561963 RepID=A0A7S0DID0_9EUKA